MSSYRLKKVGRQLTQKLKMPNMELWNNQQQMMSAELSVWSYTSQYPDLDSTDVQEGYTLAALYFSEKNKEQKSDYSSEETAYNTAIRDICIEVFEDMLVPGKFEDKDAAGFLARLIKSVDFSEKHYGRNGYLKVTAKPFIDKF